MLDFPGGSVDKNLPAVQETLEILVQFLGQEYTLEGVIATHSSILAWRIPRTEELGRLQSIALENRLVYFNNTGCGLKITCIYSSSCLIICHTF